MMAQPSFVARAVLWSHNQLAKPLAKSFLGLPAEDLSRVFIPPDNETADVHNDNRIQSGVEHGLQSSVKEPPTHVHVQLTRAFSELFQ